MTRRGKDKPMVTAKGLARRLQADERQYCEDFERDGHKAFDAWLKSAEEAGVDETRDELLEVGREDFAAAWDLLLSQGEVP